MHCTREVCLLGQHADRPPTAQTGPLGRQGSHHQSQWQYKANGFESGRQNLAVVHFSTSPHNGRSPQAYVACAIRSNRRLFHSSLQLHGSAWSEKNRRSTKDFSLTRRRRSENRQTAAPRGRVNMFRGFLKYRGGLQDHVLLRSYHEVHVQEPGWQPSEPIDCHSETGIVGVGVGV